MNENKAIMELKEVIEEYERGLFSNLNGIIKLAYDEGFKDAKKEQEMGIKFSTEDVLRSLARKWNDLLNNDENIEEIKNESENKGDVE